MHKKTLSLLAVLACASAFATVAQAADADLDCKLHYNLTGWSLIYKHTTGTGTGTVTCNNGQSMAVRINARALGLTAGKWHGDNGTGRFSDVHHIREVLGGYAQASANAGLVKSGEAQVLTKGPVSLALAGAGEGVNLGVDIGQLKIKPAK